MNSLRVRLFVLLSLAMLPVLAHPLFAATISFGGTFVTDDHVQLFNLAVSSPATVVIRSYGYGGGVNSVGMTIPAGGFDTLLTLFAGNGTQIVINDDDTSVAGGGCLHVNAGVNGCLDSYISSSLTAGSYILALTLSGNTSNGNLSDGFAQQGNPNFTCAQGFCDGFGTPRNGTWAVDIDNVRSAGPGGSTPEPATWLLTGTGLALWSLARRRSNV